ncbi:MAG TPA: glycosyltransferase [Crocinitomicaceae bacterium]|nr:glycosyltransferase [Crocinitomicaceae bacterium]
MKATLIISVYKDVSALHAILRSVELQTEKDFAIIIAQDADENCFQALIADYQQKGFAIQLLQQEDNGFQKNKILNKAILTAQTEKLIFIDGDCVLHPEFIAQHIKSLQPNSFCAGSRADLDEKTSKAIHNGQIIVPTLFQMLKNKTIRAEETFRVLRFLKGNSDTRLLGCNMSFNKSDLLKLNGFDEDYINAGYGEDVDIEFRALKLGLRKINVRYRAIQYHLFHERPEREDAVSVSRELFLKKKADGLVYCVNGIVKQ